VRATLVARRTLYVLIALLVVYCAVEVKLRLVFRDRPDFRTHLYLWPPLARMGVRVSQPVPGLEPRSTIVTTSSGGLRADEVDVRDDSVFRIMTLGGSVTECLLLGDGDTWPHQVQTILRERNRRHVWVGNAGRSGHNSIDYVVHARMLVPQFRPQLVVVMAGGNDVQAAVEEQLLPLDLRNDAVLAGLAPKLYIPGTPTMLSSMEPSYTWFFLARYWRTAYFDYGPFYARFKERCYRSPKIETFPDLDGLLEIYRFNLDMLADALHKDGRQLVLMTHPYLWKDEMPDSEIRALWGGFSCLDCANPRYYSRTALKGAMDAVNRATIDMGRARKIPTLDLEPLVPKDLLHFYDDAHLKEAGAHRVAEALSDFLIREKLIP
jgi:hypothetical protein